MEGQKTPSASSFTAMPAPPRGRGSLSGFYCILEAPERTKYVQKSQATLTISGS